jgi:acyl-CoA synthetase (NDP forming)
VVIYKGGLSEAGQRAVASHTASMGGSRRIWEAVLKQAGAIQVSGMQELANACLALSLLPRSVYRGVTVVGGGGALGVAACDTAEAYGLQLPPLSGDIHEAVYGALPKPGSSAANPIDIANPFVPPNVIRHVLTEAGRDERVDIQIQVPLLYHFKSMAMMLGLKSIREVAPFEEMAEAARIAADATGKPVVAVLPNPRQALDDFDVEEVIRSARSCYLARKIPVFASLPEAFQAVRHVSDFAGRPDAGKEKA